MNLTSIPNADARAFFAFVHEAAYERRHGEHGKRWEGVSRLAALTTYAGERMTILVLARRALHCSQGERVPDDIRTAYRSLAFVLFRLARGRS